MAEANRFLEELFWPAHNARFARPAADTGSAFVAFAGTLEDIAAAIAPLAAGEAASALRQITPAVERTVDGGVSVTVTAAPVGPDFEFLNSTPLDDVWSRAGSSTSSR